MNLLWTIPAVLALCYIVICIRRANKVKSAQQGGGL